MADLTIIAAQVSPVKVIDSTAGVAGEAFTAGVFVRRDANTGRWLRAAAGGASTANVAGVALSDAAYNGSEVTVLHDGIVDLGLAVLDALLFDAPVYLSNTAGRVADTVGTVSVVLGKVVPGWASNHTTPDRLLRIKF